jgi:hypothetical protein
MKCPRCSHNFVIRTDPKNCDYEFVSGIRPKAEGNMIGGDGEVIIEQEESAAMPASRTKDHLLEQLEHTEADKAKAAAVKPAMILLADIKDSHYKDDYSSNAAARRILRGMRHEDAKLLKEGKAVGLNVALLPPSAADTVVASQVNFTMRNSNANFVNGQKKRQLEVKSSSIFGLDSEERRKKLKAIEVGNKKGINPRNFTLDERRSGTDGDRVVLAVKRKKEEEKGALNMLAGYESD